MQHWQRFWAGAWYDHKPPLPEWLECCPDRDEAGWQRYRIVGMCNDGMWYRVKELTNDSSQLGKST